MGTDRSRAIPAEADVVVCGAGLAGLTAATVAASEGARVVLIEPHRVGGRARTDERDGFRFNLGPHALYEGGHAARVLDRLGVTLTGAYPDDVGGQCVLVGDRVVQAPVSASTLLRSGAVGVRGKVALGRVLAAAQRTDPAALADVSVTGWLDSFGLTGDARRLAEAMVRLTTYCSAPDLMSAQAFVGQIQLGGVRYLDGGWQSMVDALVSRAQRAGVATVSGSVTSVESDGAACTVRIGDVVVRAAAVVLAVGSPQATARLAGLGEAWVATAGPSMELSCLDLGIRRPIRPWFVLGVDEPLYLAQPSPPAALAPEGMATLALARYHAPGEQIGPDEMRAQLHAHARRAGVDADDIVTERYLHRMVAVHGLPLATRGGLAGRPSVEVAGRPGLFVAGDWVGAEGLLADASFASGELAGSLAGTLAESLAAARRAPVAAGDAA